MPRLYKQRLCLSVFPVVLLPGLQLAEPILFLSLDNIGRHKWATEKPDHNNGQDSSVQEEAHGPVAQNVTGELLFTSACFSPTTKET